MKIISNFKDYYDYLQGIYGIDEKIVYERICHIGEYNVVGNYRRIPSGPSSFSKTPLYRPYHKEFPELEKNDDYRIDIHIGDRSYSCNRYKGRNWYTEEDLKELRVIKGYDPTYRREEKFFAHSKSTLCAELGFPVILRTTQDSAPYTNIRLSDFWIPDVLPAEEAYLLVSNFLTREKPIKDTRTDIQKLTGHGFDKKDSFRHPIK